MLISLCIVFIVFTVLFFILEKKWNILLLSVLIHVFSSDFLINEYKKILNILFDEKISLDINIYIIKALFNLNTLLFVYLILNCISLALKKQKINS